MSPGYVGAGITAGYGGGKPQGYSLLSPARYGMGATTQGYNSMGSNSGVGVYAGGATPGYTGYGGPT